MSTGGAKPGADGARPDSTASGVRTVQVSGGEAYQVLIGTGILEAVVPGLLQGATTIALLHQPSVAAIARQLEELLGGAGRQVHLVALPDGERAKELRVAAQAWDRLAALGVSRSDAVIGLGGGAVTDLAGFVAATWLRGVALLQIPTTLLGMVDAAIGGKTAINIDAGKNLVGAFHPPIGVVCDLAALAGLPAAEMASGAAEVAKCGFIADPAILDLLGPGWSQEQARLTELITRSVAVKAEVVSRDLKEAGPRQILNYGHTLGHAIERHSEYRLRHGEAVSVGLVYAAEVAQQLLGLAGSVKERHRELLGELGLPIAYSPAAWPQLRRLMSSDKKSRGAQLRMVLLEDLARPRIVSPPEDLLEAAYRKVCPR